MLFLVFTSADIIFHKFLELHSTLSEVKTFVANFSSGFTNDPPPLPLSPHATRQPYTLNGKNLPKMTKVFVDSPSKFNVSFNIFKKSLYVSFVVTLTIQREITLPKMVQIVRTWLIDS